MGRGESVLVPVALAVSPAVASMSGFARGCASVLSDCAAGVLRWAMALNPMRMEGVYGETRD